MRPARYAERVEYRYAYIHGFASGPRSYKGVALKERLASRGIDLWLPDLNRPSFARLSHRAMLQHLDEMDGLGDAPWRFIGSSLGGWLAARWAEMRPQRVERLVLLCPGFNLAARWPLLFGQEAIHQWREEGTMMVPDGSGTPTPLHYEFFEESQREPAVPEPRQPTLIIHGRRDEVVPFTSSESFAKPRVNVTLVAVDDDHGLAQSLDTIENESLRHFGL